jgi:hypothetical protein
MNASIRRWSMAILFKKHILRVYIMKYSNLGMNNECIKLVAIRWSVAASKLECRRPCCNLLDALVCTPT